MKHKKLVTLALATALTASMFTPAFADSNAVNAINSNGSDTANPATTIQDKRILDYATTIGTVQEVGEGSVLVKMTRQKSSSILMKVPGWWTGSREFPLRCKICRARKLWFRTVWR